MQRSVTQVRNRALLATISRRARARARANSRGSIPAHSTRDMRARSESAERTRKRLTESIGFARWTYVSFFRDNQRIFESSSSPLRYAVLAFLAKLRAYRVAFAARFIAC